MQIPKISTSFSKLPFVKIAIKIQELITMHEIYSQLLLVIFAIWATGAIVTRFGLPALFGQLSAGVVLGPSVLGFVQMSETIEILATIGIFFLLLHAGLKTPPGEFGKSVKRATWIAIFGSAGPFIATYYIALNANLEINTALMIALTMSATATVITLNRLDGMNISKTPAARTIMGAAVFNNVLTIIGFAVVMTLLQGKIVSLQILGLIVLKAFGFFLIALILGRYIYPRLILLLKIKSGKNTLLMVIGLALLLGVGAEQLGFHFVMGAYFATLFIKEEFLTGPLYAKVEDRIETAAYALFGPLFFLTIGLHIDLVSIVANLPLILLLVGTVIGVQILTSAIPAWLGHFSKAESLVIAIGMIARAELALIVASLALSLGAIDQNIFTVLVITTIFLSIIMHIALKFGINLLRNEEPYKEILIKAKQ
jgi:Kef-type K+ transport system membrane component KefB